MSHRSDLRLAADAAASLSFTPPAFAAAPLFPSPPHPHSPADNKRRRRRQPDGGDASCGFRKPLLSHFSWRSPERRIYRLFLWTEGEELSDRWRDFFFRGGVGLMCLWACWFKVTHECVNIYGSLMPAEAWMPIGSEAFHV